MGKGGIGIEDAVGGTGGSAEGIAVQQVGAAAQGLSQNDGRGEDVRQCPGIQMMAFCVDESCDDTEQHPALDGHASLPDIEELCEMMGIVVPVEEKDIPEPCP